MFYDSLSDIEKVHVDGGVHLRARQGVRAGDQGAGAGDPREDRRELCAQVAAGLGLPAPKGAVVEHAAPSPALAQIERRVVPDLRTRWSASSPGPTAIWPASRRCARPSTARGCGAQGHRTARWTCSASAKNKQVVERTNVTARSVEFDALVVAEGAPKENDIKAVVLLHEVFRQLKPIGGVGGRGAGARRRRCRPGGAGRAHREVREVGGGGAGGGDRTPPRLGAGGPGDRLRGGPGPLTASRGSTPCSKPYWCSGCCLTGTPTATCAPCSPGCWAATRSPPGSDAPQLRPHRVHTRLLLPGLAPLTDPDPPSPRCAPPPQLPPGSRSPHPARRTRRMIANLTRSLTRSFRLRRTQQARRVSAVRSWMSRSGRVCRRVLEGSG